MVHTVRDNWHRDESNHVPSDENRLVLGGAKIVKRTAWSAARSIVAGVFFLKSDNLV